VLAGEFTVINKQLIHDLMSRGLWTNEIRNKIIAHNGSIQRIEEIPNDLKNLYKTVWEISQKTIINMAADRGAFIDQSQSLNLFIAEPDFAKLTSMHFYAWKKGLKTGMYYLRTRPAADAIKFTVDAQALNKHSQTIATEATSSPPTTPQQTPSEESFVCKKEADCFSCSS
jgi:ribonucleotide reductase alpha subunit